MTSLDVQAEFVTLRADLDKLRTDVATLTKSIANDAAAAAGELAGEQAFRIHAALDALEARLAEAGQQARTTARHGIASVERQIARNPLSSLALAFGGGLLIGRLLDR